MSKNKNSYLGHSLRMATSRDTTSPVTIDNLPDRDFALEQVTNRLPTSSRQAPNNFCVSIGRRTLSDTKISSVEPQQYSTYGESHFRIYTILTYKNTEVVGNLLGACLEPVGNLLQSKVLVWEILNCNRTRSMLGHSLRILLKSHSSLCCLFSNLNLKFKIT